MAWYHKKRAAKFARKFEAAQSEDETAAMTEEVTCDGKHKNNTR